MRKKIATRSFFADFRRSLLLLSTLIVVVFGIIAILAAQHPSIAQAAWFDGNWGFRQKVPLTNTSGSTQTDFQVQVTIDTATLITAGKLQSSCQDVRFTNTN